ncbi:DUF6628 family protein [Sphingomonas sp.]|uniref:DUF6628 family protein n=1 Tax=Sphingomonas sp. TaxID=28214 RepID=UPI002CD669FF|nr:DUF6628 family protein [Sphingomonas sp.]HTG39725.1 DUF6628 family protein [Sphingomonas sp.]
MPPTLDTLSTTLPHLQPSDPAARLILFGIRQMGAQGLQDAAASHAFMTAFGVDFRRPLLLLRTLMHEMSLRAARPIQIAPWCCPRMTAAEATLVDALRGIEENPRRSAFLLADLIGVRDAAGIACAAQCVVAAFNDLGLPLRRD